jgi:hypothetical protein
MPYVLKLLKLEATPLDTTPYDNQYLVAYAHGEGITGWTGSWLVTSPTTGPAVRYPDAATALAVRTSIDPECPWRWDGKPNYPLARYTVQAEQVAS